MIDRRTLVGSLGAGLLLGGCDKLDQSPTFKRVLRTGERLTYRAQRLVSNRTALAPEYAGADRSPIFRANGTRVPAGDAYAAHTAANFANWRLAIDGLVARPVSLSLAQIFALPRRTQTTRHDCVEGWSAIGEWTGVPLKILLDMAGLSTNARYLVFHCADQYGQGLYYESIDLIDAFHPQTILAWALNGHRLPVPNGAPLRLRVERQLGYKQAKYVERIEAVATLAGIAGGKGGYWEDNADYEWYAGI